MKEKIEKLIHFRFLSPSNHHEMRTSDGCKYSKAIWDYLKNIPKSDLEYVYLWNSDRIFENMVLRYNTKTSEKRSRTTESLFYAFDDI